MASPGAALIGERSSVKVANQRAYRLDSIDMLRGLVLVIMAIDHVRDFFLFGAEQDPMTNPNVSAALFATRWITHFCAPVFVLLSGVSAGLVGARKGPGDLAQFLFTRGMWLIFVEIFIVATLATFSPLGLPQTGGLISVNMQVIWAIGASMVVLSGLQRLGRGACLGIGAAIVCGHNLLDAIWPASKLAEQHWPLWVALHSQMTVVAGPFLLRFVYPVLPWIGVMSLGFGVSRVFENDAARRNAILLRAGVLLTAGFLVVRGIGIYGDPNPWEVQSAGVTRTVMDFLNTTKYPPSLDYLLMTLGPAAILCAMADRMSGRLKDILVMFGRVPFAYYLAHFFVIHVLSILLGVMQGFSVGQMMTTYRFYPQGYGVGLPVMYAVWALVVLLLYPYCRWMAGVKARRRDWWLSYV
jgi:uncharacterized membrane protein